MYPFIFWGTRVRDDNYELEKFSGCTLRTHMPKL